MAVTLNANTSTGFIATSDTSGVLQLQTAGTTAVTVDASQNVGIGTSSPSTFPAKFAVNGYVASGGQNYSAGFSDAVNSTFRISHQSGLTNLITDTALAFYTSSIERMRIDTSGNVGIGTSSPKGKITVLAPSSVTLGDEATSALNIIGNNGTGKFWQVGFGAYDTSFTYAPAAIGYVQTQASGYNYGDLVFATRNVATDTAPTERMRIDSSGNVTIASGTFQNTNTADTTAGYTLIKVSATVTAGTNKFIQFLTNNGAASTGFIASNGASNAGFFAGSDRRIKTDIQAVSDGVEKVMQLKPSKFKFKENDEPSHGFIAQELNEVFPECVYKPNDGEGSELQEGQEPWAINLDKLIPYLTAAIQEQQALIQQLQADVAALKGATA